MFMHVCASLSAVNLGSCKTLKLWRWKSPTVGNLVVGVMGEHQSIAQKGVRTIEGGKAGARNSSSAAKTSVRAPGLSTDECEHPFVTKVLRDTLGLADFNILFWGGGGVCY